MTQKLIDVTGLSEEQLKILYKLIGMFRKFSQEEKKQEKVEQKTDDEDEQIKQLHQEFHWLISDIVIKEPINRNNIYDIE